MKIARITATPLNLPASLTVAGVAKTTQFSACLVEIETDDGLVGHGFTAITEEEPVAAAINEVVAPALVGEDPMAHERLWDRMYWLLCPRGQTGYGMHAVSAVDLALWDIKGKALGQPVWRLLGGARAEVPVYVTFGFSFLDRDQLGEAAREWTSKGVRKVKMVVGHEALQRRDSRPMAEVIREDAARVRAVRDAVGEDIDIMIDANCSLDPYHAERLARMVAPYGIAFFEEPITQNDPLALADLRRRVPIPLAGGQNEGLAFRFRDFLVNRSLDIVQPNVAISGGYTQCVRIAGMAQAFNVPMANGGAWPHHNMHLQAGMAHGTMVEYHLAAVDGCRSIYNDLAVPENGMLRLPEGPGLGFAPDPDRLREVAARPTLRGRGKG